MFVIGAWNRRNVMEEKQFQTNTYCVFMKGGYSFRSYNCNIERCLINNMQATYRRCINYLRYPSIREFFKPEVNVPKRCYVKMEVKLNNPNRLMSDLDDDNTLTMYGVFLISTSPI